MRKPALAAFIPPLIFATGAGPPGPTLGHRQGCCTTRPAGSDVDKPFARFELRRRAAAG